MPNQQITIREYPVAMWLIAIALLAGGGYSIYQTPGKWIVLAITGIIALLILLLTSMLVVNADKSSGTLTISHISPIRRKVRNIPIREIASIYVEQTTSGSDNGPSTTYRIVVALNDGEIYHTLTVGYGIMGAHGGMIRPADRWKIILYIHENLQNQTD